MPAKSRVPWHSKFSLPALLDHASQLRNVPCSCDLSKRPFSGSLNWAIFLSFEDGVEWVFRSPTTGEYDLSLETARELLESEVATMKYIKLDSSIPIPDVFDYNSTKFNAIGIPFILMSKASGTQLQDLNWDPHPQRKGISPIKQSSCLGKTQKEKIMQQLGAIASQLLHLRFNKIGSPFEEAGEYCVGKCLSPALIFHDRDTLGDDILRGPFEHNSDYYEALLLAFLLHVQELMLQHNVFFAPIPVLKEFKTSLSKSSAVHRWNDFVSVGGKIDSAKNRLDYCTVGHFLRRMIPLIGGKSFAALEDGFPLYHADLSTSNIFVNGDLNITCLPHPRDDTDSVLDSAFRSGFIDHHFHGEGTKLAPELWENTRRAWLFTRLVILDGLQDYRYFKELYTSVCKPEAEIDVSSLFKIAQKEDDLVELARALAEDEQCVRQVSKEEDYFTVVGRIEKPIKGQHEVKLLGIEKHAIARKITMVSELSQDFVADARLWRWIEDMTREPTSVEEAADTSAPVHDE